MPVEYRRGDLADAPATLEVFAQSMADFRQRVGGPQADGTDPAAIVRRWEGSPVLEYLARTADQYWVAERDGRVIGFARAIREDGVRDLTEFFVLPDDQSAGVGRQLLARAFSADGARRRVVLATSDARAQALYLDSGVYPLSAYRIFSRAPEPVQAGTDLSFEPAAATAETLAAIDGIDQVVLELRRDAMHEFMLRHQQGYLYRRGTQVVGYGYVGERAGPIALLHTSDFPAVLAHMEGVAAERGLATLDLPVPLINRAAVAYLLGRKYRFAERIFFCMSDEPFGKLDQYVISGAMRTLAL
jgi:GNAT superfamily N-acetyltransferase